MIYNMQYNCSITQRPRFDQKSIQCCWCVCLLFQQQRCWSSYFHLITLFSLFSIFYFFFLSRVSLSISLYFWSLFFDQHFTNTQFDRYYLRIILDTGETIVGMFYFNIFIFGCCFFLYMNDVILIELMNQLEVVRWTLGLQQQIQKSFACLTVEDCTSTTGKNTVKNINNKRQENISYKLCFQFNGIEYSETSRLYITLYNPYYLF